MPPSFSVDTLLGLPLCQGLTVSEAHAVRDLCEERKIAPGEVLFREGDQGDGLYLVINGQLEINKKDGSGKPHLLAKLGDGRLVGEMSLIAGQARRSATATATAPTVLARLASVRFQELTRVSHPAATKMVHNIAQEISRRLLAMDEKVVELLTAQRGDTRRDEMQEFQKLLADWSF